MYVLAAVAAVVLVGMLSTVGYMYWRHIVANRPIDFDTQLDLLFQVCLFLGLSFPLPLSSLFLLRLLVRGIAAVSRHLYRMKVAHGRFNTTAFGFRVPYNSLRL